MDSIEINKYAGALLGALLAIFGSRTFADILFHAEQPEKPGWELASTAPADKAPADAPKAEIVPIAVRLTSADAAAGENAFRKCASCHTVDKGGPNRVGPNLWGVVTADKGVHEGFKYSSAMAAKEGNWTFEALDGFLTAPKAWLPGTSMGFAGVRDDQERANIILYLRSLSDSPAALPGS